ncbi:MAG: RNA polymerase factor sigma-54 [Phycisphaeraceae bacterium]|nr:RNA polymerase factor sigma-54 [Phycisphaeraceae bacterium]
MQINTGQHQRLEQQMKLSPRMIQAMEILQMPTAELLERIEQELASNPTLELADSTQELEQERIDPKQEQRDDTEGERELVVDGDSEHAEDDFERLDNISREYEENWEPNTTGSAARSPRPVSSDGPDPKMAAMANTESRCGSVVDQLLDQWRLVDAPEGIDRAGRYLINRIDDDGYLRDEWSELVEQAPREVESKWLEPALERIHQTLDPTGVGARDLRECLLLQIDARLAAEPDSDLRAARRLVDKHLEDLEANRMPRIAEATGMSIDQVQETVKRLRRFHPHPGRIISPEESRSITPDARVWFDPDADRYVAEMLDDRLPAINIDPSFTAMADDQALDETTRRFVRDNLKSARWLLESIAQRQVTVMRIIDIVLREQRDYFDRGDVGLKPLPMGDVADRIGVHVATVSRAVNEKYLQTPRGIVPLRMFFSGGTETDDGEQVSWTAVQARLKEVVDQEDKSKPLSDEALAQKLSEEGIDIARRTVAKYRKQMNIPTARRRKEY